MPIRLKDIAQAAHVELSSVSRILRDDPRAQELRASTREKVKRIAKELGYHRNLSAATIRSGVNDSTVALVCDETSKDTPTLVFEAMTFFSKHQIGVRGYTGSNLPDIFGEISANQIPWVINNMSCYAERSLSAQLARQYGMKMIFTSQEQEFPDFPVFSNDDYAMMAQLVKHLHSFGHRKILLIGGSESRHVSTQLRHQAFRDTMKQCGYSPEQAPIWHEEYDEDGVRDLILKTCPTAICAIDPFLTMKLALMLERANLRIPQDVSLVSFGNSPNLTDFTKTPITAINTNIGPKRIEAMMNYFKHAGLGQDATNFSTLFLGPLVSRNSVAKPADEQMLKTRYKTILQN